MRRSLMNDSAAKGDRGDVSFSGRAQAKNEAHRARRQVRLVRVRHHRWTEQGSRFQRVFRQKVGADQQPPLLGDLGVFRQQFLQLFKAIQEALRQIKVALRKVGRNLLQQRADLVPPARP